MTFKVHNQFYFYLTYIHADVFHFNRERMYLCTKCFSARSCGQPYKLTILQPFRQKVNSAFKLKVILVLFFCRYKANVFSSKRGRTYEMLLQGGFQLLDLIITELKSHMTCQKFKVSHWWKFYLSKNILYKSCSQV